MKLSPFALLFVAASVTLSGCQSPMTISKPEPAPKSPLTKISDSRLAEIAQQSGDHQTAERLYQKLLAQQPGNPGYLLALAKLYRQAEKPSLAIKLIAPVLLEQQQKQAEQSANAQAQARLWQVLGLAYLDVTNYQEAKLAFSQAIQVEGAIGTVTTNTEAASELATSYNGLGVSLSWLGQYQEAKQSFDKAIQLAPNRLKYTSNLALNHVLQQDYQSAVTLLQPLYLQGLTGPKMRQNLALSLVKTEQLALARRVLAEDLSTDEIEQNIRYFTAVKPEPQRLIGVQSEQKQ